ncbi:Peptidyl-Lys metalloendopeptidase [Leucoagaricus sp. SymC.cos]|nr:Peptidyl-Lys metalloendopeptidase [Leucoagaricus sp. SymC.cos]
MRITPVSEAEVVNEDLVVLAPSESIDVEHDLSMSYDFRSAGEGHYSIAARSRCMAFEDNSGELIPVDTTVQAHSVHVSGRLAVARPTVEKRAWFTGCSAQQQKALYDASSAAQILAATAVDYLQTHNESTTRYTTWFGEYTPARHDYVLSTFFKLATKNNFYDSFWYDCTGSTACSKARAWVWPSDWGHIYLCPQSRIFGGNVTSGTLIHEASHFNANGASQDYSLYVTDTMNLAKTSPDKAIRNANAYDFFAENSPPLD